ncbi:MAG: hypothetical protein KC471_01395 [Flavobacteriaceae bacterium]|nr:hypothetical protein [Flavobacteriaceae bacterium]
MKKSILVLLYFSIVFSAFAVGGDTQQDTKERENHDIEEREAVSLTLFAKKSELFLEFPVLIKNEVSRFLAHLTHLKDFKPFLQGKVTIELVSKEHPKEVFKINSVARDGIFIPEVKPKYSGTRNLTLICEDKKGFQDKYNLGEHVVYKSIADLPNSKEEEEDGSITFLKEQQWKIDFAMQQAEFLSLDNLHQARARVIQAKKGIHNVYGVKNAKLSNIKPKIFEKVKKGDPLVYFELNFEQMKMITSLENKLDRNQILLKYYLNEKERFNKLLTKRSIAKKSLLETSLKIKEINLENSLTEKELESYKKVFRIEKLNDKYFVVKRAPFDGVVTKILALNDSYVESNEKVLIMIKNNSFLLEVYLPFYINEFEPDFLQYRVPGQNKWFNISNRLTENKGFWSKEVDSITQTKVWKVSVLEDSFLKSGFEPEIEIGKTSNNVSLVVPKSALSFEQGVNFIYIQKDGEHFERRQINIGKTSADFVEITSGISKDEWFVSKGVYHLRLAGSSDQVPAHGHGH